jgi:uncharacterized protein (TIGR01244 family)
MMRTTSLCRWLTGVVLFNLFVFTAAIAQQGDVPNRGEPLENLTTGGQPDAASLEALAASGFTTVIDLRGPTEDRGFDEQAAVEELGMSYVSLPVDGANGVTFENAAVLNRFLSEAEGPVLLHCGSGNRAGALLTLSEKLNGADDETAIAVGRAGGLRGLEPTVRERLRSGPTP